ncbi:MAG: DUF1802 family protein [Gemmataceae bacterium]
MNAPTMALKEWAIICQLLAEGRQVILLRKGGIAEPDGAFRVDHSRFWLYPTYVHQQETGILPEYLPELEAVKKTRPPAGKVRLSHAAEVAWMHQCRTLEQAQALAGHHAWSADTVASRFHYRVPGLFVLALRVYQAETPCEIDMTPQQKGCKSWVKLEEPFPPQGFRSILSVESFTARCRPLEALFNEPRNPRG